MKTAKFYVLGSFLLRSRCLFMLVGDVLEGEVAPGMTISIPLGGVTLATRVASVERVDVVHEGKSFIGLAVEYEDPEDLELLMQLGISGEVVALDVEPDERAAP